MKLKIVCGALIFGVNSQRGVALSERPVGPGPDAERRYFQLTDMMKHYNSDFDERKFWAYGCQCLILGDRPMSDPGHGHPVDNLDRVCKEYKDCLKCARRVHGDTCIGEFVQYKYGIRNNEVLCRDKPSTGKESACKRSLCECDAAFARAHPAVADVFNTDYHLFWTTTGWDPKQPENCQPPIGGVVDPQCCGTDTSAYFIYNALNKDCCPDGQARSKGTC